MQRVPEIVYGTKPDNAPVLSKEQITAIKRRQAEIKAKSERKKRLEAMQAERKEIEENILLKDAERRAAEALEAAKKLRKGYGRRKGALLEEGAHAGALQGIRERDEELPLSRDTALDDLQRRLDAQGRKIMEEGQRQLRQRRGLPEPPNPLLQDAERRAEAAAKVAGR